MFYLNTASPVGHHHNDFMVTGTLGHTHVRYMLLELRNPKSSQVEYSYTMYIFVIVAEGDSSV